jgi:hypothetical protein
MLIGIYVIPGIAERFPSALNSTLAFQFEYNGLLKTDCWQQEIEIENCKENKYTKALNYISHDIHGVRQDIIFQTTLSPVISFLRLATVFN